jgi:sRNA-binding regulator protein Hfq
MVRLLYDQAELVRVSIYPVLVFHIVPHVATFDKFEVILNSSY